MWTNMYSVELPFLLWVEIFGIIMTIKTHDLFHTVITRITVLKIGTVGVYVLLFRIFN
jgi:hypothetical protein